MEISEIKDKEEANKFIAENLEKIQALLNECQEVAKKFDCSFTMPGYDELNYDPNYGWEPSMICY